MTLGADQLQVKLVQCKTAASRSGLPGLDWAVNPYRGCGHACAYCYAQDVTRFELSHDWGDVVEVKVNIVQKLRKELSKGPKGVYGVGTVTDPYQPLEKKFELTRGCLQALRGVNAEVSILTKSDLVLRDIDLLKEWKTVEVGVSMASLDSDISRLLEPGAPLPGRRLDALQELSAEGIRTYLMAAPIIQGLSDSEDGLRQIVRKASLSGVRTVMWDKFNPRPMATSRLRKVLAADGAVSARPHSECDVKRIRAILAEECAATGTELLDAF